MRDAGVSYDEIEQACVSYVYGDTTCGQRCVYEIGMTGIPVYNVNNACSSGSTALMMARQLIQGGLADCALALGFEKMEMGSLTSKVLKFHAYFMHHESYLDIVVYFINFYIFGLSDT